MEQPPAMQHPASNLPPHPPHPPRKGLPPLAWAGIGCGGLAIVAMVVASIMAVGWFRTAAKSFMANPERAAAELLVRMHPDLETVRHDEEGGRMTIRTKAGEEMTLSYAEIAEGRFSFRDAAGNTVRFGATDLSEVPEWVPRVPGLDGELVAVHSEDGRRISGFYSGVTTADSETIEERFRADAAQAGMTSSRSTFKKLNGLEVRSLTLSGRNREATLLINGTEGRTLNVHVGYEETP